MKTKKDLTPGIRYRGYGFINEYGEFQFEPENTGARQGIIKRVVSKDLYSVFETDKNILIRVRIEKERENVGNLKKFLNIVNDLITILRTYDF